jgi:mannitol/fructose-specific phosphotransferase system IIA component
MQMTKILIQFPVAMKHKLDALRDEGYTTAGFIRAMLERELNKITTEPKVR